MNNAKDFGKKCKGGVFRHRERGIRMTEATEKQFEELSSRTPIRDLDFRKMKIYYKIESFRYRDPELNPGGKELSFRKIKNEKQGKLIKNYKGRMNNQGNKQTIRRIVILNLFQDLPVPVINN